MRYVKWFDELGIDDVSTVGGKNASLGEIYQSLTREGILVPNGFAVTVKAYKHLLQSNGAWEKLHVLLDTLDADDLSSLQEKGHEARKVITDCLIPEDLRSEIIEAYQALKAQYGENISLAVRSSATAEDSPEASFAGQNDTFLNISGETSLLDAYIKCVASNFTDRSTHYKHDKGFDLFEVHLSVVVMKMVRSDKASSGIMFSLDTETGFSDVVFINATYGLGENIVQGIIDPDSFYVHKPTFQKGHRAVLKRRLGKKELTMTFADKTDSQQTSDEFTKNELTPCEKSQQFCISDEDVMVLADYAIKVENHYSKQAGSYMPMDMEWAKDGNDGKIYMVQARPETIQSLKKEHMIEFYHLNKHSQLLVQGQAVGTKIGSGKAHIILDAKELRDFKPGEVLVADTTTPDWEPIMKTASAIVTSSGGRTCHAAIVARELGIPTIVGAENATKVLNSLDEITVSCSEGEVGNVYQGILDFEVEQKDLSHLRKTKTKIMMNLGNPDLAFSLASLPIDGIGLARMEFIINTTIKVHPMALIHPQKLSESERKEINILTRAYDNHQDFFIKTLSEGVATIASCVYPKPCVVRLSDFKSNEYASLLGGSSFELEEANPMIGFRGAARYIHPNYKEGFALECAAIKRVREEMGFDNVIVMIPFCRRVDEGKKVLDEMHKNALSRGENGLEVYVMCEIPNNVISIDTFSKIFDGFSIGSNDLTQLTLGVDRDSQIVASDYDELDPGVLKMIEMAIQGSKHNHRHIGICGQAPSDYPQMAQFLVKQGIDSISLNPDTVLKTIENISKLEKKTSL